MKRMFNFSSSFKICLKSNIHNSLALKGKKVEKLLIYHRVTGQVFLTNQFALAPAVLCLCFWKSLNFINLHRIIFILLLNTFN